VSILVDSPTWRWQGRRWAHLTSDTGWEELHRFAHSIGKRRIAFQGDHYDVDEAQWRRAVDAGASVVDSRVLVRRLRQAGMRRRPGAWSRWEVLLERTAPGVEAPSLVAGVLRSGGGSDRMVTAVGHATVALRGPVRVLVLDRPGVEVAVALASGAWPVPGGPDVPAGLVREVWFGPQPEGELLELVDDR
jgi:hypothetical protein